MEIKTESDRLTKALNKNIFHENQKVRYSITELSLSSLHMPYWLYCDERESLHTLSQFKVAALSFVHVCLTEYYFSLSQH